jgi:hypothetical protein
MINLKLVKILSFAGLIPFYVLSIFNFFQKAFIVLDLYSLYSLVILSFLFGSTWLQLIIYEEKKNIKSLITAVVLAPVFLIFIEIFIRFEIKIFIFGLSYFIIFLIDKKFLKNTEYLKIRKNLTLQVILTHLILLISIHTNSF